MRKLLQCSMSMNVKVDIEVLKSLITTDKSFVFCLRNVIFDNKELTFFDVESVVTLLRGWNNSYDEIKISELSSIIEWAKENYTYTREYNSDGTSDLFIQKKAIK